VFEGERYEYWLDIDYIKNVDIKFHLSSSPPLILKGNTLYIVSVGVMLCLLVVFFLKNPPKVPLQKSLHIF